MKSHNIFNKKASLSLSLETLIRLILSGLVLIILLGVFLSIINMERVSNKSIAVQNAISIGEFIDFSISNTQDSNNCYTLLKLFNLENFQSKEEGENFVYIITIDGIFVEPLSFLEEENKEINLRNPIYEFENNINIYYDKTYVPNFFTSFFFNSDEEIILGSKLDYILLSPSFGSKVDLIDNQKKLQGLVYVKNDAQNYGFNNIDSKYLILNKKGEFYNLFISNEAFSNNYAKRNLCLFNSISNSIRINELSSGIGEKIDHINYIVNWNLFSQGVILNESFTWNNGPICKYNNNSVNCVDLFSENLNLNNILPYYNIDINSFNNIDYIRFIDLIKEYSLTKRDEKEDIIIKHFFKEKDFDNLDKNQETKRNINFYDLFSSYKEDGKTITITEINDKMISPKRSFLIIKNNININACKTDICNAIFFQNNEVYFYLYSRKELNEEIYYFYSFDLNYLRQDLNNNLFFNGNKILNKEELEYNNHDIVKLTINFSNLNLLDIPEEIGSLYFNGDVDVLINKDQLNFIQLKD